MRCGHRPSEYKSPVPWPEMIGQEQSHTEPIRLFLLDVWSLS